jgi:hypothetical protein
MEKSVNEVDILNKKLADADEEIKMYQAKALETKEEVAEHRRNTMNVQA